MKPNTFVTFDDGDFDDLCQEMTGSRLRYVRFELPSSSKGTLYYGYDDGDYDSKVTESRATTVGQIPIWTGCALSPLKVFSERWIWNLPAGAQMAANLKGL